jgi:hypothetical protein
MIQRQEISGVSGNGAASWHQFDLPRGQKLYSIICEKVSGTILAAHATTIEIIATKQDGSSDTLISLNGTDLNEYNKRNNLTTMDGGSYILRYDFFERKMKNPADMLALGSIKVGSAPGEYARVTVRINWSGATNPVLYYFVEGDPSDMSPMALVRRISKWAQTLANGEVEVNFLPLGPGRNRFHARVYVSSASNFTTGRVLFGDGRVEVFKQSVGSNDTQVADDGGTLGTNFDYTFDFISKGWWTPLDTGTLDSNAKNLRYMLSASAADAATIMLESFGTP